MSWADWAARRPPAAVLHLDSAAAGRSSQAVLDAVAAHALLEARIGAYEAQQAAADTIAGGRSALGALLGIASDGIAFVGGAADGLEALLAAWPINPGDTVAVAPSEWGPNLQAFAARGLEVTWLEVDSHGVVDLAAVERRLRRDPPTVLHLTQASAHRGLVQPVGAVATLCHDAGIPLWVDAAQALGHVDTAAGADAIWATSRKWLAGPRGVGVLGIAESHWARLRVQRPVLDDPQAPVVRWLEPAEAHIAGRVGLAIALAEFLADGPSAVFARLEAVGRSTRAALGELRRWTVEGSTAGAITALRPLAGQDVVAVRRRLIAEFAVLTTAGLPARAPAEMTGPLLRISPHVDVTDDQLQHLAAALDQM